MESIDSKISLVSFCNPEPLDTSLLYMDGAMLETQGSKLSEGVHQ